MLAILALALSGLALSLYALRVARGKRVRRACDLDEHVSCTRAFTSPASRTLGIHNAWYGIVFYALAAALSLTPLVGVLATLCALAACASLRLAYVSYVRMRNFCLVCTATYLVNIALLVMSVHAM